MSNILRTMAFGAALALTSSTVYAMTPTPVYLMKAGGGDLYEVRSSKLVEATTADPALRAFAVQMIQDHTKSTADIKAAAMKSGITPKPAMLSAQQKADIAALSRVRGKARDMLFIKQQRVAHKQALALQTDYAATGEKPALKAVASQIVPVVEHHIAMLNQMK